MTSLHLSDPSFFDNKDYQGNKLYGRGYQLPFRPLNYTYMGFQALDRPILAV
jgi:hypothetical protein